MNVIALSPGEPNAFDGAPPDRICRHPTRAELHAYLSPTPARGRALVYAGGGYLQLMHDKEGVEIAQWLNTLGLDAYVLVHRLPGQDGHAADIALQDGLLALDHLATLAPLPLLHVGLSSGGHLAGVMACQRHVLQSAGAVIAYAPLNANHRNHKFPAGKPDFPPPEKQAFYDAWPIGIATEPHGLPRCPVFLAYALHDAVVPVQHALNLVVAAQQHGLDVEAHVFPQAEHGFALRGLAGTQDQWPALAARWMAARLGGASGK
ncbi:MAG: prolyl oligopeptidase family serine peptidase [Comamonadaceae bacterium]|nr:prolyl oligopeptidase family serine peptidase [Comamonadaceae bacterium]